MASSSSGNSSSGLVTIWAKGLVLDENMMAVSGFYDVEEGRESIATASNMIAWWQDYYGMADEAQGEVPTEVEEIYATISPHWESNASAGLACAWWLVGADEEMAQDLCWTYGTQCTFYYIGDREAGGYYRHLYSIDEVDVTNRALYTSEFEFGSRYTSAALGLIATTALREGAAVSVGNMSIWGATVEEESGRLTALYVTSPGDGVEGLRRVELSYNPEEDAYDTLQDGKMGSLSGEFTVLAPYGGAEQAAPSAPQNFQHTRDGELWTFSWDVGVEGEDCTYELSISLLDDSSAGSYIICVSGNSYTMSQPFTAMGEYVWSVRARDGLGNKSDWQMGGTFTYDTPVPDFGSVSRYSMNSDGEGRVRVKFHWLSLEEGLTFTLLVDGERYDVGAGYDADSSAWAGYAQCSYEVTVTEGWHDFVFIGTDRSGNSGSVSKSYLCDGVDPDLPDEVSVSIQGNRVTLRWDRPWDNIGIAQYKFSYRRVGDVLYRDINYLVTEHVTITLEEEGQYEWCLRVRDQAGNYSYTSLKGEFTYAQAPVMTLNCSEPLKVKEGSSKVTFTWSCDEEVAYTLEIDGKAYALGTATSYEATLADGEHSYKLMATDAWDQTSTQTGSVFCDATAPPPPSAPKAQVQAGGANAHLSWQAVEDASGVRYELEWRQQGAAAYTTESSETPHFTLPLAEESLYEWRVRAVDGLGQASAWVSGPGFSSDAAPPAISLAEPVQKRVGTGKTQVTLGWTASESATYTLEINGKCLSLGERHSYSLTLADGEYTYRLIATDASGNSSEVSGSVLCDATPPETPQGLAVSAGRRNQLKFRWDEVADRSGVRYELVIRRPGGDEITQTLSGQTSYALPSPEDGRYHWSLRAVDSAGNASAWAEGGSFSYGDEPPAFTLLEPGQAKAGKGKQRVTLRWSGDAGLAYSLEVDGKAIAMDSDASSWTGVFTEGTHSYRLAARDALGKTAEQVGSFTCDLTAPELRLIAPSIRRRADGGAVALFRWAANEAADYRLTIDGQEYSVGGGEHRLALAEGKHRYELVATDAAGNSSKAIKGTLTVDSIAPTLSLNPADIKAKRAREGVSKLTLKWKGERGAAYVLKVDGEAVYEGSATSRTIELADGEHRYELIVYDKAGNLSAPLGGSFRTDASLPVLAVQAPAISLQADGKGSALFAWSCNEEASYVLKVDGKVVTPDAQGRYVREGLKRGKHSYVLTATDAAGNKTTAKGSFAVTTPDATLQAPVVAGTTASFAWTAEAGVDYSLKIGRETFSGLTGSYSYDAPKDGKYSYTLTAKDAAGNKATSKGTFVIDTKAPKLTLGKVKAKRAAEGRSEATLSWKGESKAHYVLTVDGELVYEGSDTRYTLKLMDQGVAHHYRVTATDAAGNSTTQEGTFTHDATAPEFLLSLPQAGELVKGRVSALFRWAGEAGAQYTLKLDGKKVAGGKGLMEREVTIKGGWHTLTIAAKDAAGNEASRSVEIYVDALTGGIRATAPQATELAWQAEDTEGIAGQAGKVDLGVAEGLYRFELAGDGTLGIRLGGLTAAANLTLMASEGGELCTLRSLNASAGGLDRELALSAGTYYLQVSGTDGSKLAQGTPYLLDLELREGEKRQAALALA